VKKTAVFLMVLIILTKLLGFIRELVLSYFYGASNITDAYLISTTIPMVVFSFIAAGISTGYIPMLSKIENDSGEDEGIRYTNNLINVLLSLCTVLLLLGWGFTENLVRIFASGFEGETLALAVKFTRISLTGMYFMGTLSICNSFSQIKGNYYVPAIGGSLTNIVLIASIMLSARSNIVILAIGSVLSLAVPVVWLIPFIRRKGFKFRPILDLKDEHIKKMLYIALPVVLGMSVNQINIVVDRTIASGIIVGGISALNYANRINTLIQGIFVFAIVTIMYPRLSKMAAEYDFKGIKENAVKAINATNLILTPAMVGIMIFAEPIVRLLFNRGAFDDNAVTLTSVALFFLSLGMIAFGQRDILTRVFYSLQDTKTPMINASIAIVLNILLNIVLSRYLGIGGLALATSISAIFGTVLLSISLRKKLGPFGLKNVSFSFMKIVFASLLMGIIAKLIYQGLLNATSANISLVAAIGFGALLYFVIIFFMKIDEVDTAVSALRSKFNIG